MEEIIVKDIKTKNRSHPSQIRYMKRRYDTDEEYKKNQIKNALNRYYNNREELMERYKNDEELRKNKSEINKAYYLKKKAEREEEKKRLKEEEEKRRLKEEEEKKLQNLTSHLINVL